MRRRGGEARARNGLRGLLFVLLSLSGGFASGAAQCDGPNLLLVSLPFLKDQPGARVVGFRINLTAAGVYRIEHIPMGWSIYIDNDASWKTVIKGSVQVGAAALNLNDFWDFLIVQKHEFADQKFKIAGQIVLTRDFVHQAIIRLSDENFEVRELPTR
jgi:hypothetical protein